MKKALIPTAFLLAFSILTTSVSARIPEYYTARFHGNANGMCWIFTVPPGEGMPAFQGEGSVQTRGSAIVREDTDYYWANQTDPNTSIWTRRTSMKASWENHLLVVHMWMSDYEWGIFYDEEDWFMLANMKFSGYYKEFPGAPPQYVRGGAFLMFSRIGSPGEEFLAAYVSLYMEEEHWLSFIWIGEQLEGWPLEYVARGFNHRVTVWPIDWLPIIR